MTSRGRFSIPLGMVNDNPWQTRGINPEKAAAYAADISQHGLLQPPVGRVVNLAGELVPAEFWERNAINYDSLRLAVVLELTGFRVQIAFGHHRLAAFKLLDDKTIADYRDEFSDFPVEIQDLTDEQMATHGWSENEQRGDLSPVEKARAIQRFMTDFDWTQEQTAKKLGIDRSTVANKVRILDLPADILEGIDKGKISERQALPYLTMMAQPQEVLEAAAAYQYSYSTPERVKQAILAGQTNSDEIRRQVEKVIETGTVPLSNNMNAPWIGETFEGEGFVSPCCNDCPARIKKGEEYRCQNPTCFQRKTQAAKEHEARKAIKKSGLPLATVGMPYGEYKDFYSDDKEAILHVLETKPCPNMRIKEGYGAEIPGVKGFHLVCEHGKGKRCTCLAAELKRRKKEDPKELARAEAKKQVKALCEQAETAIAAGLLAGRQAVWYAIWKYEHSYGGATVKPDDTTAKIAQDFARRLLQSKMSQWEENLEKSQQTIDQLFAQLGIRLDGKEQTPAENAWGKFERIQGWIHDLPREFPTLESVRGNIANLEKLIETPGLEQEQWDPIAAARDLLEQLLPIVERWTADDRFEAVSWLVTTPPGDINFKSQLSGASVKVIDYALQFIPVEENKTKISRLQQRRNMLQSLAEKDPEETLISWMKRTGQLDNGQETEGGSLL